MSKTSELREKLDALEKKRESILASINSLKGQKSILDAQKQDLLKELSEFGCSNSTELEEKIALLENEIDSFYIEIPDII